MTTITSLEIQRSLTFTFCYNLSDRKSLGIYPDAIPKKFRENKQKKNDSEEKWSFTQNEVNIRKNATQKPLWKTGKNPGKTARKPDQTSPQRLPCFFHMWRGRKFPHITGGRKLHQFAKKKQEFFGISFVAFNVSRIGGFWCPTGWTLWSNGRFRFRIPILCFRCLGGILKSH